VACTSIQADSLDDMMIWVMHLDQVKNYYSQFVDILAGAPVATKEESVWRAGVVRVVRALVSC
jgi:hypothetical protein